MLIRTLVSTTAALLLLIPLAAQAQVSIQAPAQGGSPTTLDDLKTLLQAQQKTLEEQQRLIQQQGEEIRVQREALTKLDARVGNLAISGAADTGATTEAAVKVREELKESDARNQNDPDAPENVRIAGDFPGSIKIPGTNMAGKVGGFVRLGVVNNLDPIGSDDRFIVGEIPVEEDEIDSATEGVTISAKRSRVNLDMRMDSSVGQFRAFIEGDFATAAEGSDVYRLRHAYGQYNRFILGQTWTTFMDKQAEPEELDFEGLNSYVLSRRPIVRYTSAAEKKTRFALALENPSVEITGGVGSSKMGDLVGRVGRTRTDRGHLQAAAVFRPLSGQPDDDPEATDSTLGWGLSLSGSNRFEFWNKRDNLKYQVTYGRGVGSYINDLNSVGGQDAVFDPDGNLEALPAFGGYIAYQHYWKREPLSRLLGRSLFSDLRSTLVYGFTEVDNFDYQTGDSYRRTQRASMNLIWSPLTVIDLGFEFLWGERLNLDGNRGRATQIQAVGTFYF